MANLILDQKLAACINLSGPIRSLFRWKGKKQQAKEILMLIKTRKTLFPKLQKFLQKNHPYSVPEIIAVPLAAGSPAYLAWLASETKSLNVKCQNDMSKIKYLKFDLSF